jgi:hypothetical protein
MSIIYKAIELAKKEGYDPTTKGFPIDGGMASFPINGKVTYNVAEQGMSNMKINAGGISESLFCKAIKTIYPTNEEAGSGCGVSGGTESGSVSGLDSASKLGMLPKKKLPEEEIQPKEWKVGSDRGKFSDESVSPVVLAKALLTVHEAKKTTPKKVSNDFKYMVSWMDPKYGELVKGQKKLQNGMFYVLMDNKEKAEKKYKQLVDKGINNVKLDVI